MFHRDVVQIFTYEFFPGCIRVKWRYETKITKMKKSKNSFIFR